MEYVTGSTEFTMVGIWAQGSKQFYMGTLRQWWKEMNIHVKYSVRMICAWKHITDSLENYSD